MAITVSDLRKVYTATFEARDKWRNILLMLDLSKATIDSIGTKFHDNPKDCYREGLSEWLINGERSWGDLVEALSSPIVSLKDIAMAIERDYIKSLPCSTTLERKTGIKHMVTILISRFPIAIVIFRTRVCTYMCTPPCMHDIANKNTRIQNNL